MREVGSATETLSPHDTDVGCELASNFIAQAQAYFDVGQAGADAALRIVLAIDVSFQPRLQYQSLRQQFFVLELDARCSAATLPDVERGLGLEPVRCQPFDAERGPSATWSDAEIVPHPNLRVPVRRDCVIPQRFRAQLLQLAIGTIALELQPQLVEVTAVPGLPVDGHGVAAITDMDVFQSV